MTDLFGEDWISVLLGLSEKLSVQTNRLWTEFF